MELAGLQQLFQFYYYPLFDSSAPNYFSFWSYFAYFILAFSSRPNARSLPLIPKQYEIF